MKTFIGTKIIKARPITRGEYNAYRGWMPPEGEEQNVEGYLVEYTDGGTPNHPDHAGYVSWSPKQQFDGAYVEIPDTCTDLAPHQVRVVAEKAQLDDRIEKLGAFIGDIGSPGPVFGTLPDADRYRLYRQYNLMREYSAILGDRIAAFPA